ncbi:MAG TPA: BON domain-containing protein [Chryseosolibacter sp.]|nr:BON domain-containing protein [Chryseosolibacter sp.]
MRNYNDRIEAAYLTSRRQGDLMRDPQTERSPHEDRRNRYIDHEYRWEADTQQRRLDRDNQSYYMPEERSPRPQQPGSHRGKGPRNYKRPDSRIKEIVCDMYCDHPYLDASNIEVEVKDSEVILSGSVDDRFAKRLAGHLAEEVSGVVNVENRIRVNQDRKDSYKGERVNQEVV